MQNLPLILSFLKRNLALTLGFLLLSGCAQVNPGLDQSPPPPNEPAVQSDFDQTLAFGAYMAKSSPASRVEICRSLLKRQKDSPDSETQLHLMVGRLLSDACGDVTKILEGINALPPELLTEERMQKMVTIQTEALKRLLPAPKKSGGSDRKQKTDKSGSDQKETAGSKKNETNLLREKLEAIRSMEKHLDESGETH